MDRRVNILPEVPGYGFYFKVTGFKAIVGAFTLQMGDAIFESDDAEWHHGAESEMCNWVGRSLDLLDGSVVEVTLTVAE